MLILIDSGSSASFISEKLVQQAHLQPLVAPPLQVSVANGGK
jgi:hypothetical protein